MATHDIGDKVTLQVTFTDSAGDPVDPTTVSCTVRSPNGTLTAPSTQGTAGVYTATVEPTTPGTWYYRFAGTGSYVAAEEDSFKIREQQTAQ